MMLGQGFEPRETLAGARVSLVQILPCASRSLTLAAMLGQGFEPWSSARKANMIGRTTPTERVREDVAAIDKSVFFGRPRRRAGVATSAQAGTTSNVVVTGSEVRCNWSSPTATHAVSSPAGHVAVSKVIAVSQV